MSRENERFCLLLSKEEKDCLKSLAMLSIRKCFDPDLQLPALTSEQLGDPLGAFVTLKIKGQLRGCIGNIFPRQPVWQVVAAMAREAAFHDPRFPPLKESELDELEIEISILSALTRCPDPEQIEVGRHGLLVRQGQFSGLLLPQVATEYNWDKKTFLAQTCLKAGLPPQAWQDPKTEIYWFEAEVF